MRGDDDFLTRWSRRKAATRRGETIEAEFAAAAGEHGESEPDRAAVEAESPEPAPELPDIAALDGSSDYRPFMRPGVPKDLRREALRKLWRTNPIINSLDGLDDHYVTHDFTDGATVVADLRTAYRIGKGMLDAVEELTATASDPPTGRIGDAPEPGRLESALDEDKADAAATAGKAEPA